MAATLTGHRLGEGRRIAGGGEVEVGHLASQGGVADRATGDPNSLAAAQSPACQRHQRRGRKALGHNAHVALGTRAEIPQVTS